MCDANVVSACGQAVVCVLLLGIGSDFLLDFVGFRFAFWTCVDSACNDGIAYGDCNVFVFHQIVTGLFFSLANVSIAILEPSTAAINDLVSCAKIE